LLETIYDGSFPKLRPFTAMIPAVIVLLLITALVATETSSGRDES
jgi:hypothetical protein